MFIIRRHASRRKTQGLPLEPSNHRPERSDSLVVVFNIGESRVILQLSMGGAELSGFV